VKIFAKECCNTAKTLEVNTDTGDRVFRYRPVGDKNEHYRHCVNYLIMALKSIQAYHMESGGRMRMEKETNYNSLRFGL